MNIYNDVSMFKVKSVTKKYPSNQCTLHRACTMCFRESGGNETGLVSVLPQTTGIELSPQLY